MSVRSQAHLAGGQKQSRPGGHSSGAAVERASGAGAHGRPVAPSRRGATIRAAAQARALAAGRNCRLVRDSAERKLRAQATACAVHSPTAFRRLDCYIKMINIFLYYDST